LADRPQPISLRLPAGTRRQVEEIARQEHRSVSGQIAYMVEKSLPAGNKSAEAAVTVPAE
jgi:hypothetical protein